MSTHLIGAGVRCGQPAEEALVGGGRVLAGRPVSRHVVGVSDHQLAAVQVGAQHERDVLHPVDDCSGFRRHLEAEWQTWSKETSSPQLTSRGQCDVTVSKNAKCFQGG